MEYIERLPFEGAGVEVESRVFATVAKTGITLVYHAFGWSRRVHRLIKIVGVSIITRVRTFPRNIPDGGALENCSSQIDRLFAGRGWEVERVNLRSTFGG